MKMRDDELVSLCESEIKSALGAGGGDISAEREKAMDRYLGKALGNETEGRSQVRTREVADTIEWILPSLMRIFTDSDHAVKFEPVGPEDEDAAQQETDRVAFEVYTRNPGFMVLYVLFKDALLSKTGIAKVVWDDEEVTERETYQHLLDIELQSLLADTSVKREVLDFSQDEAGINVAFATTRKAGMARIDNIPPEEFGIDSRTTSLDPRAAYCAYHETKKTRSELVEAGYARSTVDRLPADEESGSSESDARYDKSDESTSFEASRQMQRVTLVECYIRADRNDDGIAELLKVTLAGSGEGRTLLDVEECDSIPFVALTPIVLPHKFTGLSIADLVIDLQEIKTALTRNLLDSMYLATNPQTAISNRVDIESLKNRRVGGIVTVDTEAPDVQGHLAPVVTQGLSAESFGMLEYLDRLLRQRTGVGDEVMGLDASALSQIQTTALAQSYDAARMRIEMIARIFAETGVKSLFLRVHELLQKHQDKREVIKLRNRWVQINPSEWRTRKDCRVTIGVGNTSKVQKQAALQQVLTLQQAAVAAGGMGVLVTPQHIYRTAADLCETLGLQDPSLYFADPSQMPPQQPAPDPQMLALQATAQIEAGKLQIARERNQIDAAKVQSERQVKELEAMMSMREAQTKAQLEALKAQGMLAKQQMDLHKQRIDEQSQILSAKAAMDQVVTEAEAVRLRQRIEVIEAEKDRQMEAYKAELDALVRLQVEAAKHETAEVVDEERKTHAESSKRSGEVMASLYEQIASLTAALQAMERARQRPVEVERGPDGRVLRVGGREVVRGPDGRALRLQ